MHQTHSFQSVQVRHYMSAPLITTTADAYIEQVVQLISDHRISGLPVVERDHILIGMISEHDCIRALLSNVYHERVACSGQVGDWMIREVITVDIDTDIVTLSSRFIEERKRRFPVLDQGRLVGQISRSDVLRAMQQFVD